MGDNDGDDNDDGKHGHQQDQAVDEYPVSGGAQGWARPLGAYDLRQFMFRDYFGELDGCWEWEGAAAIKRATELGLVVVERRWGFEGERVYWDPRDGMVQRPAKLDDGDGRVS